MKRLERAQLPTKYGDFLIYAFGNADTERMPHIALVSKDLSTSEEVIVRIHSECMTGDIFGSRRCDCGDQLDYSLKYIADKGGVLIYLRQEGRGIGIVNKLKAYNLQSQGLNTVEANTHLGFEPDERDYEAAVEVLKDLGIRKISLLTNNPEKIQAIQDSEIQVIDRIPVVIEPQQDNEDYIKTKAKEMGHLF